MTGQVRSGQVRSVFNVHIQGKLLKHMPVTGTGTRTGKRKGGGSKGGLPALVATREYKQSDWGR